jgi:hypothetical protein
MIFVSASSTARVTARDSGAENPNDSVSRSTAPRTAQSKLGLLVNSSFNSKPRFKSSLRSMPLPHPAEWGLHVRLSFASDYSSRPANSLHVFDHSPEKSRTFGAANRPSKSEQYHKGDDVRQGTDQLAQSVPEDLHSDANH